MVDVPTTPVEIATSAVGLLLGLILVFSGYRLAKKLAMLAGFIAGFVIGWGIGPSYAETIGVVPLVAALAAAVLLGIVLALVFRFAFRFAGAIVGLLAGIALATNMEWPLWGLATAAAIGAVVGFLINKIAIVSWTAIVGASLAVRSGVELLYAYTDYFLTYEILSMLFATAFVALVGILSQVRSLRGEDDTPSLRGSAS